MAAHPLYPTIDTEGRITLASRIIAFIFIIVLPTIAAGGAVTLLCLQMVTLADLLIFVGMYVATGLGTTVGYHRLFTHRAFDTYRPIRYAFACLGCMNAQGAPIIWASQHRQHHAFPDEPGDPHSPQEGRKPGILGTVKALWHSHFGHVFQQVSKIEPARYAPDLEQERFLCWMEKYGALVVVVGLGIPFGVGYWVTESWMGGLTGLLWGGFVRLFVINHATGAVNSLCHYFGSKRFDLKDHSGNVAILVPFTLGESWHHNHHAFPTSARHGLKWWELDPSWMTIWCLEFVGLVWGVVRIDPERQRQKLIKKVSLG